MRGVTLWRAACLTVGLCVLVAPAGAQVSVTPGDITSELQNLLDSGGGTIILQDAGVYTLGLLLPMSLAGKTLTIKSNGLIPPQEVIIRGTNSGTLFAILGGTLVLEGVTIESQDRAALVSAGATIQMNRCLVRDTGGVGVDVDAGRALLANTCFSETSGAGLTVRGGSARIAQCTFIECTGPGIEVQNGDVQVLLTILYRNGGPGLLLNGGALQASNCLSDSNGGADSVTIDESITVPDPFDIGGPWPGDIPENKGIPARSEPSSFPPELAAYRSFDFENEARPSTQVGADWEDEAFGPNMVWRDTGYSNLAGAAATGYPGEESIVYLGKGGSVRIELDVNPDVIGTRSLVIRLKPETGNLVSGAYLDLPVTLSGDTASANLTISDTEIDGVTMDGVATVYLVLDRGTASQEVFGVGLANSDPANGRVASPALLNSQLLFIDTIPPRLQLPQGDIPAAFLFAGSTDSELADMGGSDYPSDWGSAGIAVPANRAFLNTDSVEKVVPKLFFNAHNDLTVLIEAHFEDLPPADVAVSPSGFDPRLSGQIPSTVGQALIPAAQDPYVLPFWTGEFLGNTGLLPDDRVVVSGMATGGFETTVTWEVGPLEVVRAENDYWHISFRVVGRDKAKNMGESSELRPLELWWMQKAAADVTSGLNGNPAPAPQITWELARPGSGAPTNVTPCEPLFRYKFWTMDITGDPLIDEWTMLGDWSEWTFRNNVSVDSILMQNTLNRRVLITVLGADEAGNTQDPSAVNGTTVSDLNALKAIDGIDYDHWINLGPTGTVDTTVSANYWYYNMQVSEYVANLGGGPRIPQPGSALEIIVAQLDVGVYIQKQAAGTKQVHVEITSTYDNGDSRNWPEVTAEVDETSRVVVEVPPDLESDMFSIPDNLLAAGVRSVTHVLRVRAELVTDTFTVIDDTPATTSFTVYVPEAAAALAAEQALEEQTDEQPFKVFVRGE